MLRVGDQFVDRIHFLRAAGAREPRIHASLANLSGFDGRILGDQILRRGLSGVTQAAPLVQKELGYARIMHQDSVVDLRAQAGGRPVRTARPRRLWRLVLVADHHKLVVAQDARGQHAIMHLTARFAKRGARCGILVVIPALVSAIRKHDVGPIPQRYQPCDQRLVGQFEQRRKNMTVVFLRGIQQIQKPDAEIASEERTDLVFLRVVEAVFECLQ